MNAQALLILTGREFFCDFNHISIFWRSYQYLGVSGSSGVIWSYPTSDKGALLTFHKPNLPCLDWPNLFPQPVGVVLLHHSGLMTLQFRRKWANAGVCSSTVFLERCPRPSPLPPSQPPPPRHYFWAEFQDPQGRLYIWGGDKTNFHGQLTQTLAAFKCIKSQLNTKIWLCASFFPKNCVQNGGVLLENFTSTKMFVFSWITPLTGLTLGGSYIRVAKKKSPGALCLGGGLKIWGRTDGFTPSAQAFLQLRIHRYLQIFTDNNFIPQLLKP